MFSTIEKKNQKKSRTYQGETTVKFHSDCLISQTAKICTIRYRKFELELELSVTFCGRCHLAAASP